MTVLVQTIIEGRRWKNTVDEKVKNTFRSENVAT
jgi:hypothetical protein